MRPVPALFIGDAAWPEFRETHAWLERHCNLQTAAHLQAAEQALGEAAVDPLLIVIGQCWPGQFPADALQPLLTRAPLARVTELLGSWCEGQGRSGNPLPGATACEWHQWLARMKPELDRAAAGDFSLWRMPPTATEEERLLARPPITAGAGGLITIHTRSAELADTLCEAAARHGLSAVWRRNIDLDGLSGVRAAILELSSTNGERRVAEAREAFATRQSPPPVLVALTAFPREDDVAALKAAGASLVVSKPFWLDDLFVQLLPVVKRQSADSLKAGLQQLGSTL